MAEMMLDRQEIYRRLDVLDKEVRSLRELMHPVLLKGESTSEGDVSGYIERVPTILGGEPIIRGTRTPVRAIVEHWKFGHSPGEIVRQLPHLRLAQIFAALSYYDDHRAEIERYIALNRVPVDE